MVKALDWAKKTRPGPLHRHLVARPAAHQEADREVSPDQIDVIVTPYTAKTKVVEDETGLWAAMKKHDVGWFGIKPFASGSLFKGDSSPDSPHAEEDNRIARLTHPLHPLQPGDHGPDPGHDHARAGRQRGPGRQGAPRAGRRRRRPSWTRAMDRAWANLPYHYQWLKDWEYV